MNPGSKFVALSDVSFFIATWYNFYSRKSTMRFDWALEIINGAGPPSSLRIVIEFGRQI